MISNPTIEEEYSEYFAEFFKSGGAYQRYVSYIGNGIPDAQIKVGKEYKVGITVIVLIDQLRKRLEEDGVIQALKVEGKLPTIMVVPSAMWCSQHGFVLKYENQGQVETLPDYEKAMMGSPELASTINAINARMAKRGFPLKDLDAACSIIPTTTGAAKAVALVLPELKGKLNGFAMRVPTPNVSITDLTVLLQKDTTAEEINAVLKEAAEGELKGIMGYSDEPLVSRDYNGCPLSSIIDGLSTMMVGPRMAKVVSWYDNEWGYSNRLVELTVDAAKMRQN